MKTKISKNNKRTYHVGGKWRSRLQAQYRDYSEFAQYSDVYGLAARLGYDTARGAWDANPVVQGSVNSGEYQKIGD